MNQRNLSDTVLINTLAQELGLSPLDIFMNWIKNGEIKNITVSIVYKNGDEIKADLRLPLVKPEETRNDTVLLETEKNNSETEADSSPVCFESNDDEAISPNGGFENEGHLPRSTSFTRGTIAIKQFQYKNVTIGAYVYTTGDILPDYKALPGVNIRGIILSHSDKKITIIKHVGTGYTALEACSREKDGWRFLTYQECQKVVQHKERLNIKFAEMKRKQIDDALELVFRGEQGDLLLFSALKQTKKIQHDSDILVDRVFSVYMAKDLKIV